MAYDKFWFCTALLTLLMMTAESMLSKRPVLRITTALLRGVAWGGQWGTYVPGRQGTGAPKWGVQKFHNKGKKPVTSKITPVADIV